MCDLQVKSKYIRKLHKFNLLSNYGEVPVASEMGRSTYLIVFQLGPIFFRRLWRALRPTELWPAWTGDIQFECRDLRCRCTEKRNKSC
jgi:hypothetical protein